VGSKNPKAVDHRGDTEVERLGGGLHLVQTDGNAERGIPLVGVERELHRFNDGSVGKGDPRGVEGEAVVGAVEAENDQSRLAEAGIIGLRGREVVGAEDGHRRFSRGQKRTRLALARGRPGAVDLTDGVVAELAGGLAAAGFGAAANATVGIADAAAAAVATVVHAEEFGAEGGSVFAFAFAFDSAFAFAVAVDSAFAFAVIVGGDALAIFTLFVVVALAVADALGFAFRVGGGDITRTNASKEKNQGQASERAKHGRLRKMPVGSTVWRFLQ